MVLNKGTLLRISRGGNKVIYIYVFDRGSHVQNLGNDILYDQFLDVSFLLVAVGDLLQFPCRLLPRVHLDTGP